MLAFLYDLFGFLILLSLLREDTGDKLDVLHKKDLLKLLNIAAKYYLNTTDSHCVIKHNIWYYIEH